MRLRTTSQVGLQFFSHKKMQVYLLAVPASPKQARANLQGHPPLFHLSHARPEKEELSLLTSRSQVGKKNKEEKD